MFSWGFFPFVAEGEPAPDIAAQVWRVCVWEVNELFHLPNSHPQQRSNGEDEYPWKNWSTDLKRKRKKRDWAGAANGKTWLFFFTTVCTDSPPKDINTPLNKTQRPHPHTPLKIISFLTWLNLKLAHADQADTERLPLTFPEGSREGCRKQKHSMKMQMAHLKSIPLPFHCRLFTGRDLLIWGRRYWSCWTKLLFCVTACIKRGSVWRFPLERTGKAGRNIWLLCFLLVQKAMRSHAWLIYSMPSSGKQPPGNSVIVMKWNVTFLFICFRAAKVFRDPCHDTELAELRGGIWAETIP